MSSFHIYVQITIYIYVQIAIYIYIQIVIYLYPNGDIYVQNVNRYVSKCCVIFKQFDVYMSRNFWTYIYIFLQVLHVSVHDIDSR